MYVSIWTCRPVFICDQVHYQKKINLMATYVVNQYLQKKAIHKTLNILLSRFKNLCKAKKKKKSLFTTCCIFRINFKN